MKPSYAVTILLLACVRADIQDDFNYLVSIFQGLYDNYNQYESDIHRGLPPQNRHLHLITSVSAEDVPILQGRKNFYLEQYLNGNKDDLIRQRIYSFAIDSLKRIDLKIYSLVDQAKFSHAKPNSPLFKNLTDKDIFYAQGCDVYWDRVSHDLFRSHMFNTCIVPINGSQVLIIDKTTLSSKYLTADETWVFVKNGSVLKVYPGPYNMTKQRVGLKNSRKVSTIWLQTFGDILNDLVSGQPVRYNVRTSQCQTSLGATPDDQPDIGGYIDVFEYFDDPKFGPVPQFGFSTFLPKRNGSGHLVIEVREGLVHKDNNVTLKLTTMTPDYRTVLHIQTYTCVISDSASFYTANTTVMMFEEFETFVSALTTGAHVRFTVRYDLCSLGVNAIGGGRIQDFEVAKDGSMVKFSQYKIVTNYQAPGYVDDIVMGSLFSNGSAIFIATDVKLNTDKAYYVEEIDCRIASLQSKGGLSLFQID